MNTNKLADRRGISFALLLLVALCEVPARTPDRPRGIYSLGTMNSLTGLRTNDFVDGFTLRVRWDQVETAPGVYDFTLISNATTRLQALGKRLTIEIFAVNTPAYVVSNASETWTNTIGGIPTETPVPWDTNALNSYRTFMQALANCPVPDSAQGGALTPLRQHPTLAQMDAPVVGLQSIRDLSSILVHLASYARSNFVNAVVNSLHSSRDPFVSKFGFLAYFSMTDSQNGSYGGQTLDQTLLARLYAEFNSNRPPRLSYFQENLADSTPTTNGLGKVLLDEKERTYTLFQALTSWTHPFANPSAVASGNPATGIAFAYTNYGTTYFELYPDDIDNTDHQAELRQWHQTLSAAANTSDFRLEALARTPSGHMQLRLWAAPGQSYILGTSEDLLNWQTWTAVQPTASTLDLEDAGAANLAQRFYRAQLADTVTNPPPSFSFVWDGTNFTYTDPSRTFTGIMLKPAGDGPFAGLIINHGAGGTPTGYSLSKAREMSPWGVVCIGPSLTHAAGGETNPVNMGNCPENNARAVACANVLASLPYVDTNRLAIFGHSMGAFATIGDAALLAGRIRAAAMTAGGTIPDSAGANNAAPTVDEANPVRAPFIIFHCDADPAVPPARSFLFQQVLNSNSVPNLRILYSSNSIPNSANWHNLHQDPNINVDLLTNTFQWFGTQGVLP